MPEISIVVPVYKVEAYLEECVHSLMEQTFSNIEILLVDDGSPDQCGAMCDALAQKDNRIVVIHQQNQGLSCARNTGIRNAKGRYICFVDSDDMVMPDYCEALWNGLHNTEYDFSVCAVHRFEDGAEPKPLHDQGLSGTLTNSEFLKMQFERKSEFGVWNKLFRKELFDKVQFIPGKLHEDVIFSADLAKNLHHGVVCLGDELYLYRQRNGGIVSVTSQKCSPDRIFAGEYLLEVVKDVCPQLIEQALQYAIGYPWMFVDPIYVHHTFRINQKFLDTMQTFLEKHLFEYEEKKVFSDIQMSRMRLFAKSRFLYGCNAYARLTRVYLYRIVRKDSYRDGHGI